MRRDAYPLFFPAAVIYGVIVLPLSVGSLSLGWRFFPGVATPAGHAHEMLVGFALAVATGFLLNRVASWWIYSLFVLWILARAFSLLAPDSVVTNLLNTAYIVGFAVAGATRFLPGAKKWRNKAFGLVLVSLGVVGVLVHSWFAHRPLASPALMTYLLVLLLAMMMLMMGGRIIAPAIAGHIEKHGGTLDARVQPFVEGALIILMGLGIAIFAISPVQRLASIPLACAGTLAAVRLIRWKVWLCTDRNDLMAMSVGYAWLALGLCLFAVAIGMQMNLAITIHAITIGALGTLTLIVMARTWLQRGGNPPGSFPAISVALLMSLSALIRMTSPLLVDWTLLGYLIASVGWMSACLLILSLFFGIGQPRQ